MARDSIPSKSQAASQRGGRDRCAGARAERAGAAAEAATAAAGGRRVQGAGDGRAPAAAYAPGGELLFRSLVD